MEKKYTEDEIREKISNGWLRSKMWFEILAVEKELAEKTMQKHLEKLRKERDTMVLAETIDETVEVKSPFPNVEKAYSQTVEVELMTKNIEVLLYDTIFYAPSAVEILEPKETKIGMNSIQVVMNSVADLIHRYAAQGSGGVVVSTRKSGG
jgi:hypothetical protein